MNPQTEKGGQISTLSFSLSLSLSLSLFLSSFLFSVLCLERRYVGPPISLSLLGSTQMLHTHTPRMNIAPLFSNHTFHLPWQVKTLVGTVATNRLRCKPLREILCACLSAPRGSAPPCTTEGLLNHSVQNSVASALRSCVFPPK